MLSVRDWRDDCRNIGDDQLRRRDVRRGDQSSAGIRSFNEPKFRCIHWETLLTGIGICNFSSAHNSFIPKSSFDPLQWTK